MKRLPEADYQRLAKHMQCVAPDHGAVMAEAGVAPKWVHFPVSGVLYSIVMLEDGSTVEANTIGNEGMDGLYLLADPSANPHRVHVQVSGEIVRIPTSAFSKALSESKALTQVLLRYALVQIQRGTQNAACIQHHTVEKRLCRWLHETACRTGRHKFGLTQEFLSSMLGVRRQSVNLAAQILQQQNLISYNRGELTILDREGLENSSCECLRETVAMYDRLMRRV